MNNIKKTIITFVYLSNRIGSLKGRTDKEDSKKFSAAGITTFYC